MAQEQTTESFNLTIQDDLKKNEVEEVPPSKANKLQKFCRNLNCMHLCKKHEEELSEEEKNKIKDEKKKMKEEAKKLKKEQKQLEALRKMEEDDDCDEDCKGFVNCLHCCMLASECTVI